MESTGTAGASDRSVSSELATEVLARSDYNGRAYELMKKRVRIAFTALIVGSSGAIAFTKRANSAILITSTGASLALFCFGRYFLGSDLIAPASGGLPPQKINLGSSDYQVLVNRKKVANRKFLCLVIGIITGLGLLLKIELPKSIKIVVTVLSSLIFSYAFVTFPYIQLVQTTDAQEASLLAGPSGSRSSANPESQTPPVHAPGPFGEDENPRAPDCAVSPPSFPLSDRQPNELSVGDPLVDAPDPFGEDEDPGASVYIDAYDSYGSQESDLPNHPPAAASTPRPRRKEEDTD